MTFSHFFAFGSFFFAFSLYLLYYFWYLLCFLLFFLLFFAFAAFFVLFVLFFALAFASLSTPGQSWVFLGHTRGTPASSLFPASLNFPAFELHP